MTRHSRRSIWWHIRFHNYTLTDPFHQRMPTPWINRGYPILWRAGFTPSQSPMGSQMGAWSIAKKALKNVAAAECLRGSFRNESCRRTLINWLGAFFCPINLHFLRPRPALVPRIDFYKSISPLKKSLKDHEDTLTLDFKSSVIFQHTSGFARISLSKSRCGIKTYEYKVGHWGDLDYMILLEHCSFTLESPLMPPPY